MFGNLETDELDSALEALLFVTDEPASAVTLADMLECEPALVEEALVLLQERLATTRSGIRLAPVAGGWRLVTAPEYHELLERYVLSWDTRRLSQAALETLAIIAYLQPVTRANVATVRGVNSDSSINSLIDKGLVREAGTADTPGNPVLYATTRTFLEKFGLNTVSDLPSLESYAPDEETADLIRESLGARVAYDDADAVVPETDASTDEAAASADDADPGEAMRAAMRSMMGDALSQSAGAVEKIDFTQLEFEE